MLLSIIRIPKWRLSLNNIENSPRGTRFLLPLSNTKPELKGCTCWLVSFKDNYTYYLKRSSNQSILTSLQRNTYWY